MQVNISDQHQVACLCWCWTCVLGIYMITIFLILTSSLENNETSD